MNKCFKKKDSNLFIIFALQYVLEMWLGVSRCMHISIRIFYVSGVLWVATRLYVGVDITRPF